jgi:ADP-L-glycero-D-manno-heptose 6-epimerase
MIIVTGGAGFIGSAFVWKLNQEGFDDITIVDQLGTDDKWKNIVNRRFINYIHKDDFLQMIGADKVPFKINAIVHMGACSSTTERDADYLWNNNYLYTKTLAEWALKRGIRFIYASSAATYGDGKQGFSDDHKKISQLRPINMGLKKFSGEKNRWNKIFQCLRPQRISQGGYDQRDFQSVSSNQGNRQGEAFQIL